MKIEIKMAAEKAINGLRKSPYSQNGWDKELNVIIDLIEISERYNQSKDVLKFLCSELQVRTKTINEILNIK